MFYLIKTESVYYFNSSNMPETSMTIEAKSLKDALLQDKIKYLYENAEELWDLKEDDCINGASLEEIKGLKDEVDYFDKNYLSIFRMFPDVGVETEVIEYHVINDNEVEEME